MRIKYNKAAGKYPQLFMSFHFMKQNPKIKGTSAKKWWSKDGVNKIKNLGIINPDENKNWKGSTTWNSNTLYLAYKGTFWGKKPVGYV